jgi:hypothetical protein
MLSPDRNGDQMTERQARRRLQLAVDHIALVLESGLTSPGDLSEALDLIHSAEGELDDDS